jgi:biotin carboxyl carrier protein
MAEERSRGRDEAARARADVRNAAGSPERSPAQRAADHAAIDRLAGDLLPALVAKLGATGLGEIEVREGPWRVRVRRPASGTGQGRRTADRGPRAQPGQAGHGHAPAAFEGRRSARDGRPGAHSTNGSTPGLTAVGPGETGGSPPDPSEENDRRTVATSPAVGVFQPRGEAGPGPRVRAGDRLGAVDMLGVPHEVVAPVDGLVGARLVEAGQPVEYGQDLVLIEPAGTGEA